MSLYRILAHFEEKPGFFSEYVLHTQGNELGYSSVPDGLLCDDTAERDISE